MDINKIIVQTRSKAPGVGLEPRSSSSGFILLEYKRIWKLNEFLDCDIVFLNYCRELT
jgi:hypothetical protein